MVLLFNWSLSSLLQQGFMSLFMLFFCLAVVAVVVLILVLSSVFSLRWIINILISKGKRFWFVLFCLSVLCCWYAGQGRKGRKMEFYFFSLEGSFFIEMEMEMEYLFCFVLWVISIDIFVFFFFLISNIIIDI